MKLLLLIISLMPLFTFAQDQTGITSSGQKITLKANGTWEYEKKMPPSGIRELSCAELISVEEDKVSGKTSTATKDFIWSKSSNKGAKCLLLKTQKTIVMSLILQDVSGCIDEDARVSILYKDGTRVQTQSHTKFNCSGKVTIYLGGVFGKEDLLNELRTKEIDIIRVDTRSSYYDYQLTGSEAPDFKKAIDCLVNNY